MTGAGVAPGRTTPQASRRSRDGLRRLWRGRNCRAMCRDMGWQGTGTKPADCCSYGLCLCL